MMECWLICKDNQKQAILEEKRRKEERIGQRGKGDERINQCIQIFMIHGVGPFFASDHFHSLRYFLKSVKGNLETEDSDQLMK